MVIRDGVQTGSSDEGWAIHAVQRTSCGSSVSILNSGDPQGVSLLSFYSASEWHKRCTEIFVVSITGVG